MNPKAQTNFKKNHKKGDRYGNKRTGAKKKHFEQKAKLKDLIDAEVSELTSRYKSIVSADVHQFSDLPLSQRTLRGLKSAKYTEPTEIQRESAGLALQGHDILGAAKTGSGKTLAFLIPILECLYRQKWSSMDGMGALIISPTRELAYQTFEVLRRIGRDHDFSAGLVIGGKHLREESQRINQTNIVICTPGRLLQHMDETVNFTADSLQVLVLDEADRILDLGFSQTMNAIIENLPSERQTLLFSATQTKSVKDLARLSLSDPMFVSVHEHAEHSTPAKLTQSYVVCELHEKLSMLWSFIKNHLKSKVMVFLSCCKEVKYVYEAIKKMRPGTVILCLHGGMNQLRRVEVYNAFCRKHSAVLFATDIAARGLDFPVVNWVIQLDCPEDANTYIHRAGRTARFERDGEALLVLMPSEEEAMLKQLAEKKIPINKIKVNAKKMMNIQPKLESQCAADPALKDTAQRAFVAYLRGIFLMSNKEVFDVNKLDIEKFARSLGLAVVPRVRFLQRAEKRRQERMAEKNKESADKSTKVLMRALKDAKLKTKRGSNESSDDLDENSSDEIEKNQSSVLKFNQESDESSDEDDVSSEDDKMLSDKLRSKQESDDSSSDNDDDDEEEVSNAKLKTKVKSNADEGSEESSSEEEDGDIDSIIRSKLLKAALLKSRLVKDSSLKRSSSSSEDSESENSDSETSEESSCLEARPVSSSQGKTKQKQKMDRTTAFNFNIDEDEEEDEAMFRVRRRTDLETDEENEGNTEGKESSTKKKPITKAKQAKKLLKKKIQLNTKVKFDEEGEEIADVYKKPQVKMSFKDDDDQGGIDITEARRRLQEEDKFDKQLHRQKIKQRHREERLKKKEEQRKKRQVGREDDDDDDDEAVLAGGEEGGDPLDYVPDPDNIYDQPEDESDETNSETDEDEGPSKAKKQRKDGSDEESDEESSDEEKLGTGTTVDMDEEMALRLLRGAV